MSGRIRTIKPEILDDDKAAGLSDAAWRLWVSLWLLADDHGNLRGNPKQIDAAVFWGSLDESRESLARLLDTLANVSLIRRYTVRGQPYVAISNWKRHQRVDHPGKPRVPTEDEQDPAPPPVQGPTPDTLAKVSRDSHETLAPDPDLRPPTSDHDMSSSETQPRPQLALVSPVGPTARDGIVDRVFRHWQQKLGKPRAKRLPQRMGKITARLREGYTEADLIAAIDGLASSEYHRGVNDRGVKYDDLELILRDGVHVEKYAAMAGRTATSVSPAERAQSNADIAGRL